MITVRPLAFALVVVACHGQRDDPSPLAAANGDDVRTCAVAGLERMTSDSAAVRCAEWFVVRNGYTVAPPADTSALASESMEWTADRQRLLASRRGTLAADAVVLCRGFSRSERAYTIGFSGRGDRVLRVGRAVTMDAEFRRLQMQHVDFSLDGALRDPTCSPVLRVP